MPRRIPRRLTWPRALLAFALLAATCRGQAAESASRGGGMRLESLAPSGNGRAGFADVPAAAAGIAFTNRLADERSITNQILLNGSGVAAGDVDGDGRCDLYLCGLDSPNALYRNLGAWRFEDITTRAGGSLACADQASTGAVFADLDGDGDLDLLVNGITRGTRLFLNDGRGHFREATAGSGFQGTAGSHSLALADVDGDGRLDVYVVNYRSDTMRDMPDLRFRFGVTNGVSSLVSVDGRPASSPDLVGRYSFDDASGVLENGEADVLYMNRGEGRFEPVPWNGGAFLDEAGRPAPPPYDWGLSAMFRDIDGDGDPDLYVCNDFQSPDRLWINDGTGRFRAAPAGTLRHTSLFSMGVDFADLDRDDHDDFFVADMLSPDHERRQVQVMDATAFAQFRRSTAARPQFARNMLFRARGDGTFAEIAPLAGVEASDWTWCPVFLDVDLDGYEDLLLTTGHWRDAQHADVSREIERDRTGKSMSRRDQLRLRGRFPRLDTPNVAFRNRGNLTFQESGEAWGFASRRVAQGMALADLDGDGDQDVVVNCLNDAPLLCRNDAPGSRIAVRLEGRPPNTRGIGARIRVVAPGLPVQTQEMIGGGRYLSGDDARRTFAVARPEDVVAVEVTWRDGARTTLTNVPAQRLVTVAEAETEAGPRPGSRIAPPASVAPEPSWFEDVSSRLQHRHVDDGPDEFPRQPLLPHATGQNGPGIAWFDFNGDGFDDLLVGTGQGGRPGVYRNDGHGGFVRQKSALFETPADRDLDAWLGWKSGPSTLALIIARSRDDDATPPGPTLRVLSLNTGTSTEAGLPDDANPGPLALADVDGDGALDLFVGGRPRPGRYPEPAGSALFRGRGTEFTADTTNNSALAGLGVVKGAIFADLDGDGRPELVVAREWQAPALFRNRNGTLVPWEPSVSGAPSGTRWSAWTGGWTSVVAADFDEDGRLDLALGNWGRNTRYQAHLGEALRLDYGEVDGSGRFAHLESYFEPKQGRHVPFRDWGAVGAVFPMVRAGFPGYAAFARAGLDDLLRLDLPPMRTVTAATLDSVVLLNRGDAFERRPLPFEAQVSPVFGMAAADLDGDGHVDLVVAQNAFGMPPGECRLDAGLGTWLRGDGKGGFLAVPTRESGIRIDGEGRGLACSDFDGDGRVDLAAGQFRGETKLFHNRRARPGLRVRLKGGPANPSAIGAQIRLHYPDGTAGPLHELQAGSGYLSQDSATPILGWREGASAARLQIRWPNGATESVPVTTDAPGIEREQPAR